MNDSLIISYDNCPPDVPTLMVAKKYWQDFTVLNKIQGDAAFGIYHYLIGEATLEHKVVHAKWGRPVLINGHWYRPCSNCLYSSAHGAVDNKEFMPNFCSNCGATMDAE